MENKFETRSSTLLPSEDSRLVGGYAVRFDEWSSDLGGFREIIHRGAITEETIANSDIIMNINHDDEKMLARCTNGEGTLKLELRDDGVYFLFEIPPTPLGDELLYNIKAGNIRSCSFCFDVQDDDWYRIDGNLKRAITKVGSLYDMSIVNRPAYPTTSLSLRCKESLSNIAEADAALDALENKIKEL